MQSASARRLETATGVKTWDAVFCVSLFDTRRTSEIERTKEETFFARVA